jgi:hypothetical protein
MSIHFEISPLQLPFPDPFQDFSRLIHPRIPSLNISNSSVFLSSRAPCTLVIPLRRDIRKGGEHLIKTYQNAVALMYLLKTSLVILMSVISTLPLQYSRSAGSAITACFFFQSLHSKVDRKFHF